MQINTVQQFVEACKRLDSNAIYEMFEAADDTLRDAVYAEAVNLGVVLADENEPTRASMYALGVHYNVQSLRDF